MKTARFTLVALGCVLAACPAWGQQAVAKLQQVTGNVLVSGEAGLAAAVEAQGVPNGARIITTANSRAVVVFENGCRVEMGENQRLEVDNRKPCAALLAAALGAAEPAVAAPLVNLVIPGLIGAGAVGGAVAGGGGGTGGGDGGGPTPLSPN